MKGLHGVKQDPRPPLPSEYGARDVVDDHYVVIVNGKEVKILTSRVYCPKHYEKDESLFDPTTPQAKFARHLYAARFKNARRRRRDIAKRMEAKDGDRSLAYQGANRTSDGDWSV